MTHSKLVTLILFSGLMLAAVATSRSASAQNSSAIIGERPTLADHVNQADIESQAIKFKKLLDLGEEIFAARWTKIDGQGRPAATGAGVPTKRDPSHDPGFIRTSGTDSTSCADCHNQPTIGGAGGFVANVFVLAQTLDPVTDSVAAEFSNERNTLDMKGVNFGQITVTPEGSVDSSRVEGVDADLIIKPFHQKGVVNSVRVFTVNAFNHHHGMQAVERFGVGQKDSRGNIITTNDFDEDGVPDEMTVGDITAATIFQAAMNIPGRVLSDDPARRGAAQRGETRFADIGCTDCHRPSLTLSTRLFSEPNPFNPAGNLRVQDVQ